MFCHSLIDQIQNYAKRQANTFLPLSSLHIKLHNKKILQRIGSK